MNVVMSGPPAIEPRSATARHYTITVAHDEGELKEHLGAWEDLVRDVAEPNAFYEPWALLPALRQFSAGQDLRFVLVYSAPTAAQPEPLLCGLFPFQRRRIHRFLPVVVLETWRHLYGFLCTPLLRAGHGAEVVDALFAWLRSDPRGAALIRLQLVSGDGAFMQAVADVTHRKRRPTELVDSYCRAMIEPHTDGSSYVRRALAGRHLKEYRRKERLLAKGGLFERRVMAHDDDPREWADMFLGLEARGWKGREGTAMVCRATDAEFFRDMVEGAFAAGKLEMLGLFLDGRPLAMKCNLRSGAGAFAFKIAFDEAYAANSPGMLLELVNIEHLHQTRSAAWMDSCAIPEHPMINRLWLERRIIVDQYLATGRGPGDALVSLMPFARWLKRFIRTSDARPQQGEKE
jgi:hypothetical protein